ncbi:MAG: TonB-dependent receptor [Polyangiaceae bacterium]|nr:TonB-dependent receptor [Polyangiaceae bacterium]
MLAPRAVVAAGNGVLTGTVTDAASGKPLADVTVVVVSPSLQGAQTVLTDGSGLYRVPNLPPGQYSVSLDLEGYKPYSRGGIGLASDSTVRMNAQMLPVALRAEEVVVVGEAPTVDVGSTATGRHIDSDFTSHVPVISPNAKGSASRSFESVASVAPGANADQYGTSINGTTSPENQYVIDGVSVNDPAYGILGTPLSIDFIEEVNVVSGGYMPEYGRSTGGVLDVVTKSGSNKFRGTVFTYFTPGAFEGPREEVRQNGNTISMDTKLVAMNDFGFDFGGPIVKDKLWFYTGFDAAFTRYKITRQLNKIRVDAAGVQQQDDVDGVKYDLYDPLEGTQQDWYATERAFQYIGKLNWAIDPDHQLSLSVYGTPTFSGSDSDLGVDNQSGRPENQVLDMVGNLETIHHRFIGLSNNIALAYKGAFDEKKWLFDAAFGWHYQQSAMLPADGSRPGDKDGLAAMQRVLWRRAIDGAGDPNPHPITDFESVPNPAECRAPAGATDPTGAPLTTLCPANTYQGGGPDYIDDARLHRFQTKATVTRLQEGAGHHVIKGGLDLEIMKYDHEKTYSGGRRYRESLGGGSFTDNRGYGFLAGPDDEAYTDPQEAGSLSTGIGAFVQDSWAIMDLVTLNVGLRYDAQILVGDDGKLGMALPHEWSPRIGAIYDFTQKGHSKIYASFAMYYESMSLDMVDRSFPGERQILSVHGAGGCPRGPSGSITCDLSDDNRFPISSASDPNQYWIVTGGDKVPVDPGLKPQSSSEFLIGGEYEVFPKGTIGVHYTRRWMNNVIEDMSRDEGQSYFIGNPGSGIASDFPEATRTYDALSIYFDKKFDGDELLHWLVSGSYTVSWLRGNWAGLFRPETGQLDPNINSDFDLVSLLPNRDGRLPGDSRHHIKVFGATSITPDIFIIDLGLGWRSTSGEPTNYLGAHDLYGDGEVFILPRGTGDETPWTHRIDGHLGFGLKLAPEKTMILSMDVFNLFNFQGVTGYDETYTYASVLPVTDGNIDSLKHADGTPFDPTEKNPNFGRVTSYQTPRQFRLGLKATF